MPRTSHLLAPVFAGTASAGPPILPIAPPALLSLSREGILKATCEVSLLPSFRSSYTFKYHLNPFPNSLSFRVFRPPYQFRSEPSSLYPLSSLQFPCRTEKTGGGQGGVDHPPLQQHTPKSDRTRPNYESRNTSHKSRVTGNAPLSPFPATLTGLTRGEAVPYSRASLCRRIAVLLRFHWKQLALAWIMPSTPGEGAPIRGYT
jgi:hypothetical protein